MKTKRTMGMALSGILALSGALFVPAHAQPVGGDDFHQTFEDDQLGWTAFGKDARLGITRDPDNVKQGNAALQLNYNLQKGEYSAMGMPATPATMKSMSFWIKTDHATPIALMLQETGGGRWGTIFHVPENEWQRVELTLRDFLLQTDADSPKDPNNTLDLDKVEWAGLGDFGQFFLGLPPQLAPLFGVQPGPRTLWLDDLTVSGATLAQKETAPETVVIDDFVHPQLSWIPLANAQIMREESDINGAKMPGLRMDYQQSVGRFAGLIHRLQPASLSGIQKLSLRAQSENAAKVVLQLEETSGGKYNTILDIPAGDEPQTIDLTLENFKPADDSKDDNGQLDMAQVHQMMMIDTAAIIPGPTRQNSLWIGDLRATK